MQMGPYDLTNQQLLSTLVEQLGVITGTFATKEDLQAFVTKKDLQRLESVMATKSDLQQMEKRLIRQLNSHKAASTRHHLETRQMIGELHQQHQQLREGLLQAAGGTM
ncbi:MAG TPA: hypothetical protein VG992_01605 [Candidatus Saccharimonadales bacterium]|nr:hypothetical protein [Candidatus Saccharimonadales bacterium]